MFSDNPSEINTNPSQRFPKSYSDMRTSASAYKKGVGTGGGVYRGPDRNTAMWCCKDPWTSPCT